MKKIKILMGIVLLLTTTFAFAQNGLENVIVEKYYVSNAADAANADADLNGSGFTAGTLPAGSVTYRVYADLTTGWNLQAVYGVPSHELKLNTTTQFYNNSSGSTSPTWGRNSVKNSPTPNVLGLDSYFSLGAAASNAYGVMKSEDNSTNFGANLFTVVGGSVMQNADASALPALTTQDGYYYSGLAAPFNLAAPTAASFAGNTTTPVTFNIDVLNDGSTVGNSISTFNGSVYAAGGVTGPTANNRVLIGQFTTSGSFSFELNFQLGGPGGAVQNWVAKNPASGEFTMSSLTFAPPAVTITSPATTPTSVITGTVVNLAATATDNGTISQVEFFDGVTSLGIAGGSGPSYTLNWTSTVGSHNITAKATDNDGLVSTSSIVVINVANNQAPTITVSAPATAKAGSSVNITATTGDVDGTVSSVEFFVDNVSIGTDNTPPTFSMNWTATLGSHTIKGIATDNLGATTTSSNISINVVNNVPPTASITSPTASATYTAPQVVTINASATDPDGTVTQVDFYVNNVLVGSDANSPYSFDWTSVIGAASLTVKSTDDNGAVTTSAAVVLDIADPNALPYKMVATTLPCSASSFCMPIRAVATVSNVIGYDITMNYNVNDVTPTGAVTKFSDLVSSSFFDVDVNVDAANGKIYLSAFFNSTAPAGTRFSGTGDLLCVEFTKNASFATNGTTSISVSSLQESYITNVTPKLVSSGLFTSFVDNSYNSSLKFWGDNSPIQYDLANPNGYLITNIRGNNSSCSSPSTVAVQPDLAGNFTYDITNGLYINIDRDILPSTSVQPIVNGADAVFTRQLLVNDPSFVPNIYQAIAMDVNIDGVISAGDVSQINQRTVLIIPEFKQAWNYNTAGVSDGRLSKDWLFVDQTRVTTDPAYTISSTFPLDNGIGFSKYRVPKVDFCLPVPVTTPLICPTFSSETYKGVMMGDVNGSYAGFGHDGLLRGNDVLLDLTDAVINKNIIDVPVLVSASVDVKALDFAMQFDESKLKYNSISLYSPNAQMQALDHFNSDDRTLRFTSNSLENYDVSKPVAIVRFEMKDNVIDANSFNNLEGWINGKKVGLTTIGTVTTGVDNINYDNLVTAYPNPASSILNVEVSKNATVQLFDVLGKQVMLQSNVNANEKQELNIENLASGVYMLKVSTDKFVSTQKIVIERK